MRVFQKDKLLLANKRGMSMIAGQEFELNIYFERDSEREIYLETPLRKQ